MGEGWINGGFFVLDRKVLDYIDGDLTLWSMAPWSGSPRRGSSWPSATGYWQPMDTLRERELLESLWQNRSRPLEGVAMS